MKRLRSRSLLINATVNRQKTAALMNSGIPDLSTLPGHSTNGTVTIEKASKMTTNRLAFHGGALRLEDRLGAITQSIEIAMTRSRSNRTEPKTGHRLANCRNQLMMNSR